MGSNIKKEQKKKKKASGKEAIMEQRVLLISYSRLNELKKEIKNEEEFLKFLKEKNVEYVGVLHYDDMITWVNKEDFICTPG